MCFRGLRGGEGGVENAGRDVAWEDVEVGVTLEGPKDIIGVKRQNMILYTERFLFRLDDSDWI